MLLHYPPPNPSECIREDCPCCRFFQRCREVLKKKYGEGGKSLKEIETQARKNSLGCLDWEGYTPE